MSDFGTQLREKREKAGLSFRVAATKAGFSEATWRQYEKGYRQVTKDVTVPVTPSKKNVRAAAVAVGWDVASALRAAGYEAEVVGPVVDDEPVVAFPDPAADPGARPVTEARLREEMDRVHDELAEIKRLLSDR